MHHNLFDSVTAPSTAPEQEPPSVSGVQVRLPEFMTDDPELWFAQVETQFFLGHITSQNTKFCLIVPYIPHSISTMLRGILCTPPKDKPYDTLKEAIISRFSVSEDTRLNQLLGGLRLGHQGLHTPTQLLSYMRGQAQGLNVNDNLLRHVWLKALPTNLATILQVYSSRSTLDELAETADRIHNYSTPAIAHLPPVTSPSSTAPQMYSADAVMELTKCFQQCMLQMSTNSGNRAEISPVTHRPARSHSKQRTGRSRSRSRASTPTGVCWYHRRFGEAAKRCVKPCSFVAHNSGN